MAFTSRTAGLAKAAIAAAGSIIDGAVRALVAVWAKAWKALAGLFLTAVEALLSQSTDGAPSRSQIDNDPGVRRAMDRARHALDQLADLAASEITTAAQTAVTQAAASQAEVITSQLPGEVREFPRLDRGRFHDEAMLAIGRRSAQRITKLTQPLSVDADRAMRRELIRGVRFGRNPRDSAEKMIQRVEGAFNGGLSRALVIARTEVLDAYRQAAEATQKTAADVLAGWVWLAELGPRTCPACWAMHGTVHPLDEPGPLGHPQCRCARAPKTRSWRDLGFDIDEPEDQLPDAETAFRALPRADQLRIMGPARLDLLDIGQVAWTDLARRRANRGWRPSYTVVPLKDLT